MLILLNEILGYELQCGNILFIKIMLRNKIKEKFLANSMMIYIKRELVKDIDSDSIINELYSIKYRRVQL
jgi:hypothetical protein